HDRSPAVTTRLGGWGNGQSVFLHPTITRHSLVMHTSLPWPVSPEFEDALALATQRHLAQPSSPAPRQHSLAVPSSLSDPHDQRPPSPASVPRSASLMMKTRVAVRDKTPHRFQVVPLRDAAQNRDKSSTKLQQQQPAPWTRQLMRPSGVGLGLGVSIQRSPALCASDTPERGRERTRASVVDGEVPIARKSVLRGLQGLSPKRALGSPDRKENRTPGTPTKLARRRRQYTFDSELGDTTITPSKTIQAQTIQTHVSEIHATPAGDAAPQNTSQEHAAPCPEVVQAQNSTTLAHHTKAPSGADDITMILNTLAPPQLSGSQHSTAGEPRKDTQRRSHHFKSPSLGAIHHLLSAGDIPALPADADTPRVRCRKRTNTLSAGTKRYGVYTPGKLDFSPVVPQDAPVFVHARYSDSDAGPAHHIASTYSLGALLAAYSYDSLPSMYSQDSFVEGPRPRSFVEGTRPARRESTRPLSLAEGTHPLRVHARALQGREEGDARGLPHAIVLDLMRDVDLAIGEWL
ncbi:hypothetical protein DFH09DRAFT_1423004, partial [Mycena vulgaris]